MDQEKTGVNELNWVKSSFSFANGNCVEVAIADNGDYLVRNSREPEGLELRFTPDEWNAFVIGVKNGEFGDGCT